MYSLVPRLLVLVLLVGVIPGRLHAQAAAPPLVFEGVTVIDVEQGQRLPVQRVVIVGNRIQALGPVSTVPLPKGAQVVNAQGKYLIPGLWDLHVHPHQYVDLAYPLFIANGVTGVRDAGSGVPLATLGRWKREIAAGTRVGPRLIVSGQSIWGDGSPCDRPGGRAFAHSTCIATPAEARVIVDSFQRAGADMLKLYGPARELHLALIAEAKRVGIPFGGHAGNVEYAENVWGLEASDSGSWILDHMTWFSPAVCGDGSGFVPASTTAPSLEACTEAAQRLRRNNTWVAVLGNGGRQSVQSRYMLRPLPAGVYGVVAQEPSSTAEWAQAKPEWKADTGTTIGARMYRAGIPIVVGTDTHLATDAGWWGVPGFSVAETLVAWVLLVGMTPLDALQAATLNPARALRMADSLGTVAVGKVADLMLLDADPLTDIWHTTRIRAVVANGRYFDRAALDTLLQTAEAAARRYRADTARGVSPTP